MRKWLECETDRDAPLTLREKVLGGCGVLSFLISLFVVGQFCGGCMSENTGSSTVIGEQLALPEITDASDSIAIRVYESIKGARVWTARDSKVAIDYTNTYTNSYFGIVETRDIMNLKVEIEPLDCGSQTIVDGGK